MTFSLTNSLHKPRVFLGPIEVAGQIGLLSRALRKEKIDAVSLSYLEPTFGQLVDISSGLTGQSPVWKKGIEVITSLPKACGFDVYHFQFGFSLLPGNLDIPLLRALGKKIVMHYHGDDLRQLDIIARYKYNYARYVNYTRANEHRKRRRYAFVQRFAQKILVSTPDLLEFAPGSQWLPVAIDPNYWTKVDAVRDRRHKDLTRVIHAPSDRLRKGTHFLVDAIKRLQKDGEKVELVLLEKTPHGKVIDAYAQADIAVDQLLIGAYGTFAIEAMVLGKPTLCYIRDDLRRHYPKNLPIIETNPDNLADDLKSIIHGRSRWPVYARAGREYVARIHDVNKVKRVLMSTYKSL